MLDREPKPPTGDAAELIAVEEKLLACVHCGFCLPACPTYTRLGDEADSPRGRLHLMRAVLEGRLEPTDPSFLRHLDRCVGCRACESVCPASVEYGAVLQGARAVVLAATGGNELAGALAATFGSRPSARLVLAVGRLLRWAGIAGWLSRALPKRFARIRHALAMLAASGPSERLERGPAPGAPRPPPAPRGPRRRVALLRGCVQDGLFRRVNEATERVLALHGCELVRVPDQECCGAIHAHAGALAEARRLALRNLEAFEGAGVDLVVVNSAGCGAALKEYAELFEREPAARARAEAFAARVRDVSEVLVELGPIQGAALELEVGYDAPCHLQHAQRVSRAPLEVLGSVPGLVVKPLSRADECCGGAGIFGLINPGLAGQLLEDKLRAIRAAEAEAVATPNPGCMLHIGAGLWLAREGARVVHPIELLDESYRRAGYYRTGGRP